jgi:aminopeptidase N
VQDFYGDVYGPGPMVLYVQLEGIIGRPAVLEGIKSFLAEPGARSVADLRAALEQASSMDLGAYFDAWVLGQGAPEWPTLAVALSQQAGEVTVTVTQQNPSGKRYGCAVEVLVAGATQTALATVDFGAAPSSATATATIPFPEQATGYTLDPDHRLVARDAMGVAAKAGPPPPVWIF